MTQPGVFTPYTTVSPLLGAPESWMPPTEMQRIQSYQTYEEIYWSSSETLQLYMRGFETPDDIIYVPTARTIVETVNRYVGNGIGYLIEPETGTPASQGLAQLWFRNLFARERFRSRYAGNKRYGLIRGDWLWHVTANPNKPEGRRISILPVDPASYFPVTEDQILDGGDPEKTVKVHLVDQMVIGDKTFIRRQTYERVGEDPTIYSSLVLFEPDKWFVDGGEVFQIIQAPTPLPSDIPAFPVYHIPNFDEPSNPWGSSELRGFERLLAAIDQSFTDEDITLALEGLGVYTTKSGARPRDVDGNVTDWSVYPGRVIQNAEDFRRVPGVTSVVPYGDHITRMLTALKEASGANDAAIGRVDVAVAESGVALLLHLAPMLAKAEEKDQIILDKHGQMYHDLRFWFQAYEGVNFLDVTVTPTFGDKLPVNRAQEVQMVSTLMTTTPPVLSAGSARAYLARRGFGELFAENEAELVAAEQAEVAVRADPFGERQASEGEDEGEPVEDGAL